MAKQWMSGVPKECDICHEPLEKEFVDGATVFGPWGIMCIPCHELVGMGLGTGRGQRYDLATRNKLEG